MYDKVKEFHKTFGLLISDQQKLPDDEQRQLRKTLMKEEINESLEAETENDISHLAKELADVLYIACGTMVAYGIKPLYKIRSPYNQTSCNPSYPNNILRHSLFDMLNVSYNQYLKNEETNDIEYIKKGLNDIIQDVFLIAQYYNIPIDEIFDEVHSSNMSKVCKDGTILRREDGKIIKPDTYVKADTDKIIEKYKKINNNR